MANKYQVIKVQKEWQLALAYNVRIKTMVEGEGVPASVEFDDDEIKNRSYYILLDGDEALATCRVNYISDDVAKIERVIVSTEHQNKGVGTVLLEDVASKLKDDGTKTIIIDSRDKAVHFYERIGYRKIEDEEKIKAYETLIDDSHLVKKEKKESLFVCFLLEKELL